MAFDQGFDRLLGLVGIEQGLGDAARLEQCEAQKNCVAHNAPNGCDNVIRERNRLNQNCIYANADHD